MAIASSFLSDISMTHMVITLTYCHVWISMVTSIVTSPSQDRRSYRGSEVLRIQTKPAVNWSCIVDEFLVKPPDDDVDVWQFSQKEGWMDIRVSDTHVPGIINHILRHNLTYHVTHSDVGRDLNTSSSTHGKSKRDITVKSIIGRYARYDEILSWMEQIVNEYPNIAQVINIGTTYEGRPMKVLKLGKPGINKRRVWIDGGIHAREWISPATVLYIANRLLKSYLRGDQYTSTFLRDLDWYILPVVNPDGYEYTHTQDRLWRKNRQSINGSRCHGIDLNRNWGFHWGGAATSSDPCDALFKGNSPHEAQEVQNIARFLLQRAGTFTAFLTYHAYGQNFISRWDYSKDILPKDHKQLISLANRAARSITKVHGVQYEAGRAPEILYPYGGGSPDWAKAIANAKYSYLIELRDKWTFLLPESEIIATGQENWAGIRVVAKEILKHHGNFKKYLVPDPPIKIQIVTSSSDVVNIADGDVLQDNNKGHLVNYDMSFLITSIITLSNVYLYGQPFV